MLQNLIVVFGKVTQRDQAYTSQDRACSHAPNIDLKQDKTNSFQKGDSSQNIHRPNLKATVATPAKITRAESS